MFRQVLIPVDGSSCSLKALEVAAQLAKENGATCTVCMAVDIAQAAGLGFATPELVQGWLSTLEEQAQLTVDAAAAKLRALGVTAATEVAEGNPTDAILEIAKKHHADIIIMGSHGRSGLRRIFLGSVAESVLHRSQVPVLVVRETSDKVLQVA